MIITRKHAFLIGYTISLMFLLFTISDFIPLKGVMSKVKYVYIIGCILDMVYHSFKNKRISGLVVSIFVVYAIFCVLFGLIIVTPTVEEETFYQFKTTVMMLVMLFLTYFEMEYYDCFDEFVTSSFVAISMVLLVSVLTHIGELGLNPFYVVKILSSDDARARSTFGLGHWNYVGFLCFVNVILSFFIYQKLIIKRVYNHRLVKLCAVSVMNTITVFMLISASTRAALLSLIIFGVIYVFMRCLVIIKPIDRIIIVVIITVVLVPLIFKLQDIGLWSYIWKHSRSYNVSVNMPIFEKYGDFWTGMGWVETGALQEGTDAFGLGTSSIDMFYLYIFFTTGCLGCIFMGIVYGCMGLGIFLNRKKVYGDLFMALYLSILFYLFWETILFTIKFWEGIPLLMLLFHGMTNRKRKKNKR